MNFEIPKIVALVFVTVSIPLLFCQESVAQTYGRPQLIKDPRDLRQQAFQFYLEARYDEAAELYQEAIELAKESYGEKSSFVADLYYEAGSMCLEEGNFSMASRFLPLAVKINPNYTMARVKLSELLMMKGKSDEAFGQIGEALKRDPTAIEAQRQLVKLLMDREKKEKDISRGAGLACTWESFRLNNLTKMVVNQTLKHIAQWQTKLKTGQSQVPTVSVAMSSAPVLAKPEKPPEREKQTLPVKTTKAKTPVNTPPRTVKAKPKPVLAKKEKPKPKP
ncbi:MAG: tetratricopeptide repeat protein, partial [Candidatus Obscuribacterales bacterium]|nr:tetratricopeptide repeat protein [Candidatus Obscuribacterales bacterium]